MENRSDQQNGTDLLHDVVAAIATVRGVGVDDLDVPLYEVINSDALVKLFESSDTTITLSFQYDGHEVVVRPDTSIAVDGTVVEPRRDR